MWRVVFLLLICSPVFAQPVAKPDLELEKRMRSDIEAASTDAVAAWDQGNLARDAHQFDEAAAAYRKAIGFAPKVDHLHRRLCGVLSYSSHADDAVRECELAISLAPLSDYNKAALAQSLLARGHPDDRSRAAALAQEAARALPDDLDILKVDCVARSFTNDVGGTSACAEHMLTLAPDDMVANMLAAQVALARGDPGLARARLELAKKAGLPAPAYDELSARINSAVQRSERMFLSLEDMLRLGIPLLVGWLAVLGLLLLVGYLLSKAVQRGAGHLGADAAGTPRERRIRRAYRFVLGLTGLLFYVSLPLLIFVVIAAGVVTIAIFDEMGGVPIIALFLIIMVVGTTAIAIVRALFFRPPPKIEGIKLELATFPKLEALLAETAEAIGTSPVDSVYLTPGTDASVFEQASLRKALFGSRNTRVLMLGVGQFRDMKQRELRSILAHEYGHFRNADTGGVRALAVKGSLVALLRGIATSGYAKLNPAWWLLRAFTHLYLIVSSGASRLQEQLADRWAIRAYGSDAFIQGLRHVARREVEFALDLSQTIKDVVQNKWSLPNLYTYAPEIKTPASAIDAAIEKRMKRTTRFDSHPSMHQRLEWAEKVALPGDRTGADDLEPVWSLFPDPEKIERDMTAIIRERIRVKLGVTVSDAEWDDEDDDQDDAATSNPPSS